MISIKKITASFAVVLLLLGVIFLSGCTEEEERSSPEEAFESFVEKINDQDGKGALELTDSSLIENESYDEGKDDIKDSFDNGEISIKSYDIKEIRYEDDISSENTSWLENATELLDEEDVSVEQYCLLEVNWTTENQDQGEQTTEVTYPMFKVDSNWYVGLLALFMNPKRG